MSSIMDNSTPCFVSDCKTSQSEEDKILMRNLPGINLPEKILLVIDTVRERDCTPFKLSKGINYMPLFMIKRVVEHFICMKSTIQRCHEYALMTLNSQSAEWICDFTNNISNVIDSLDVINEEIIEAEIETAEDEEEVVQQVGEGEGEDEGEEEKGEQQQQRKHKETVKGDGTQSVKVKRKKDEKEEKEKKEEEEKEDEKSYDLGQLFDKIEERVLLSVQKGDIIAPKYVTRVILLYSRSTSVPKFDSSKVSLDNLTKNPYFFVDVLYVHEPPCSENLCEEIYSEIARLDTKNVSYILEVGRNAAKLHDNMAKLLAHPLQRPQQKDVCYTINSLFAS